MPNSKKRDWMIACQMSRRVLENLTNCAGQHSARFSTLALRILIARHSWTSGGLIHCSEGSQCHGQRLETHDGADKAGAACENPKIVTATLTDMDFEPGSGSRRMEAARCRPLIRLSVGAADDLETKVSVQQDLEHQIENLCCLQEVVSCLGLNGLRNRLRRCKCRKEMRQPSLDAM